MPINYEIYGGQKVWLEFSEQIRKVRANNRCEICGIQNYSIYEMVNGKVNVVFEGFETIAEAKEMALQMNHAEDENKKYKVAVLTVAHLDSHGGVCNCKKLTGFKCRNADHVKAMCCICHLKYDATYHIQKRIENTAKRKDSERGLLEFV